MSEDGNKSYKSGATGRRDNQIGDSLNIFKKEDIGASNQTSQANVSVRGMRPPLKKKG
jgi:hypothetical protein